MLTRLTLLLALLTGCAHVRVAAPPCSVGPVPPWHKVAVQAAPDGGSILAPAEARKLAQDIAALQDWSSQAAACLNVPHAARAP